MDKRPRQLLGRYEILAELGRGAMGIVYKARDPQIDRLVAIKTISLFGQTPEDESDYLTRLFLEARAAGRLSHPGIVTIFDVGEECQTHAPYIVMEYVDGDSLGKMLDASGGKLPLETALQLTQELGEALDYAHTHGVVHRDMKPANVLVTKEGKAKIADFGIAKMNLAQITLPGHVMGTPAFMSPEQLEGAAVDGRSDLFSLGVILYTMLTGHRPFQGNSAVTVSFKVANREPVPATAFDSEFPPEIDYVISRAMAKEPSQRYQTGREMALDINELIRGRTPRSKGDRMLPNPGSALPTSAIKILRDTRVGDTLNSPAVPAVSVLHSAPSIARKGRSEYYLAAALVLVAAIGITAGLHRKRSEGVPPPVEVSKSTSAPVQSPPAVAVAEDPEVTPPAETTAPAIEPPSPSSPHPAVVKSAAKARISPVSKVSPKEQPVLSAHSESANTVVESSPARTTTGAATLQLQIEHQFSEATLWLWVDGKLVRTQTLQGENTRKLGLFHGIRGNESVSLPVPVGERALRVRVASGEGFDASSMIAANLTANNPTTLRVKCDKGRNKVDLGIQ